MVTACPSNVECGPRGRTQLELWGGLRKGLGHTKPDRSQEKWVPIPPRAATCLGLPTPTVPIPPALCDPAGGEQGPPGTHSSQPTRASDLGPERSRAGDTTKEPWSLRCTKVRPGDVLGGAQPAPGPAVERPGLEGPEPGEHMDTR
ncbi:hypothetical protein P7K49_018718 [Saguinus oedipus]|uniref:Uncharacterized protein n=1 Tax=Saguinus oedipus TaxID=9490 RepID=A0ABQ9V6M2_SAGOE|nr:hypothetical protein P7K49_018718 [Saguinus oedipus]